MAVLSFLLAERRGISVVSYKRGELSVVDVTYRAKPAAARCANIGDVLIRA